MPDQLTPDESTFLEHLPADGSAVGNQKLRERLDWDEGRYELAKEGLLALLPIEENDRQDACPT